MKLRPATKEDYDVLFELFSEVQTLHYDGMPDFCRPAKKDKFFYAYFDEVIKGEIIKSHDLPHGRHARPQNFVAGCNSSEV